MIKKSAKLFFEIAILTGITWNPALAAKTRTLDELIGLAMKEGKDETLNPDFAELLGFGTEPVAVRNIFYEEKPSIRHDFYVLVRDSKPYALALIWNNSKTIDGVLHMEGYFFRASLKGSMERAFHFDLARFDDLDPKEITSNKPFKKELAFFLKK